MSRSQAIFLFIIILLGAGALRLFDITGRSLWFDEAFSWRLIHFPFYEMIARDAMDVHPPLYYILLKGWSVIYGTTLFSLRSFSVLMSLIAIIGGYFFSSYAFRSRNIGLLTALLLAVSGWNIAYAWEARMYPLGMALAFFSSYALLKAFRSKKLVWFAVYALLATGLLYTHYYGLFTIMAHVVFVVGVVIVQKSKKLVSYSILTAMLSAVLFAPWFPTFLQQSKQVHASYWVPPIASTSIPDTFYQFFIPTKGIPPHHGLILLVSLMPIIGVIAMWIWMMRRKSSVKDGVVFTALLGLVPFLLGIVISFSGRSLYNDRFFAFAGIFIFCALAYALWSIPNKLLRGAIITIAVVGLFASFVRYFNELDFAHHPGGESATRYMFEHRDSADPILVSSPYVYFAVLYYASEQFMAENIPHLYSKNGELSHFSGGPIMIASDIVGPRDINEYKNTVWVVDTTGYTETPFEAPRNWKEVDKKIFPEVFVYQGDIVVRQFAVK